MSMKYMWTVPIALALALAGCSGPQRMTVEEAFRRAPEVDGREVELQGFVVITRHSLGVVEACGNGREIGLVIPAGLDRDPETGKLVKAIYGRQPISYWTAARVVLQGRLYSRGAGASPEFVLAKVLEQVQTASKCELPNYAPTRIKGEPIGTEAIKPTP
jgi:hypothetical protein